MNTDAKTLLYVTRLDDRGEYASKYPGQEKAQFRESYKEMVRMLKSRGVRVCFVDPRDIAPDAKLRAAYELMDDSDTALRFKRAEDEVKPDIIVNRVKDVFYTHPAYKRFAENTPVVNEKEVADWGNKAVSQRRLADFLPVTKLLPAADSVEEKRALLSGMTAAFEKVVVKPVRENGGKGIVVITSYDENTIEEIYRSKEDLVLQQFIETSSGVRGIAEGRHDVRLYVVSGKVIAGAVRRPQDGEYLANTSQGGSITFLQKEALPSDLMQYAKKVLQHLALPKTSFLGLDFFSDGTRWYLIEANDQPGIPATYQDPGVANTIYEALLTMYTEAIAI